MIDKILVNMVTREVYNLQNAAVRGYQVQNGDIFTVSESRAIHVMRCSNQRHIFMPLERYKNPIWYRPSTWFQWLWKIQYIEYEEGDRHDD